MTISEFSNIVKEIVAEHLPDLNYRPQTKTQYNIDKKIEPVFLFVPPRNWSGRWREHCEHSENVTFMIGEKADLKPSGEDQFGPYSPLNFREAIIEKAETFMVELDKIINVMNNGLITCEFWDAPDGLQANNLSWVRWDVEVKLVYSEPLGESEEGETPPGSISEPDK